MRGVVLEVALGGGPPADGAGAGGVPDLGQVPEPDPGVVPPGLVPVLARVSIIYKKCPIRRKFRTKKLEFAM
jgi:hypothetical protein